jgi:hypothetical protein
MRAGGKMRDFGRKTPGRGKRKRRIARATRPSNSIRRSSSERAAALAAQLDLEV